MNPESFLEHQVDFESCPLGPVGDTEGVDLKEGKLEQSAGASIMSTNEEAQEAKAAVKEEPAPGRVFRFDQMEEKQIQIVVEQLISLTIRKKGPQGAEGAQEAGNQASGGSAEASIPQEAEPGKGSALGRRERRKHVRRTRVRKQESPVLCECPQGQCPVCFYLCPMCSTKKCEAKYCKNRNCIFRKNENESEK